MDEWNFQREMLQRMTALEVQAKETRKIVEEMKENAVSIATVKKDIDGHERRISGIEAWGKWLAAGVGIALLQAVLSVVVG
jgi:hypothetical protein